ncbi:MAG TPA: glycine--tRNA ligase subunit beta, partial [Geothrix sp.]|nr:glycine--tRNA ligase subunit beta [Geothrix sp.]
MSGTKTFLLELHCEEIPARFLKPLTDELAGKLEDALESWIPTGDSANYGIKVQGFYSPRKIALRLADIPVSQPDQTETQVGPPQRMCVDEAGKPTIQGLKFAEKWGVDFGAVRFEQPAGKKEPCAVVTITRKGRPTVDLLAETLPGLIAGLHVPKAMRWGKSDFEFVRPIRNILCLFGEQVVPITVDGVTATNTTWGHRLYHRQHPEPVRISTPEAYEAALEAAGVVVSVDVRRARIAAQLEDLAAAVKGRLVADAELLDTLAEIVEFPTIVRGEFPASFLELPKEVLVTSLREHQKSFCIEDAEGALLPFFLTAANRTDDPSGFVKAGNEWVLKARLYDARFFFAEDRKHPLSDRLEKLQALTFQRDLGSYHAKTGRVVALVKALATRLSNDDEHIDRALEAARMAKCDLRTLMVGEFPELQGIMGGEYLKHEGAHEDVWMAVKEHYRPVGADDAIPSTPMGCLLSLCDKLDTVAGCFAVGLIPSGSKDPLALRRAGQGIVRILWERGWA